MRSINFMGDSQNTDVTRSDKAQNLHLVASELLLLKHEKSAMDALEINNEVLNAVAACGMGATPPGFE